MPIARELRFNVSPEIIRIDGWCTVCEEWHDGVAVVLLPYSDDPGIWTEKPTSVLTMVDVLESFRQWRQETLYTAKQIAEAALAGAPKKQ